jgi:hypothetical protein
VDDHERGDEDGRNGRNDLSEASQQIAAAHCGA